MNANGKVAFITGANKGLGLEIARQLAQNACTVLLCARDLIPLLSNWGETLIYRGLERRKLVNFPKVTEEKL